MTGEPAPRFRGATAAGGTLGKGLMEPSGVDNPPDLRELKIDVLRQALAIYLAHAYPEREPPEAVRRRLQWPEGAGASALLSAPPFERVSRPDSGEPPIYALRLGNAHYPHMKLQIQPWPNAAGFLVSVNTHDQVLALEPGAADAEAFRALQSYNQEVKEAIEAAWDDAGLPTFLRYLRDYIDEHPGQ